MNNKKLEFTLAEVLITLGIIGVVAALTMPMLMQKYNNSVAETRLNRSSLMNDCKTGLIWYCTALISQNGWKVPKYYPKKIKF